MADIIDTDKDMNDVSRGADIPEEKWDDWRMTPLDLRMVVVQVYGPHDDDALLLRLFNSPQP